jgi:hypothetical protein
MLRVPFAVCAFAWRRCARVAQDRGEERDCCRVFDPFGELLAGAGAPHVVDAGLADGGTFLVPHRRGGRVLVIVLVRWLSALGRFGHRVPADVAWLSQRSSQRAPVRSSTCRRAREA